MKVLIDTNIILDYALLRQPFYDLADCIFALIEKKQIEGYVGASTFSDLFYILNVLASVPSLSDSGLGK